MLYTLTSGIYPTHLKKVGSEGHRSKQKNKNNNNNKKKKKKKKKKNQKQKQQHISQHEWFRYQVNSKTDFIAFQLNDIDGMYHNSDWNNAQNITGNEQFIESSSLRHNLYHYWVVCYLKK